MKGMHIILYENQAKKYQSKTTRWWLRTNYANVLESQQELR